MNYKVEKGIPIPATKGNQVYPWREMEVGDSFCVLKHTGDNVEMRTKQQMIQNASRSFRKKSKDCKEWQFVTRMTKEELRIWRTK